MSVFQKYARYYDLFYKEKNYLEEADYVRCLISRFSKNACSVLELGCGTGKLALLLADSGFSVTGFDLSEEMLDSANERLNASNYNNVEFKYGDLRTIRTNRKFDVVISLFHVFSYQTSNNDIIAALTTAKEHLTNDGILIFDCWYGPAVLSNKPEVRVKTIEDDVQQIIRIASPALHANNNIVDVNYTVLAKNKDTNITTELKETHSMRYFFLPEVRLLMNSSGLSLLHTEEWLTGEKLDCNSWNAVFIATARHDSKS